MDRERASRKSQAKKEQAPRTLGCQSGQVGATQGRSIACSQRGAPLRDDKLALLCSTFDDRSSCLLLAPSCQATLRAGEQTVLEWDACFFSPSSLSLSLSLSHSCSVAPASPPADQLIPRISCMSRLEARAKSCRGAAPSGAKQAISM